MVDVPLKFLKHLTRNNSYKFVGKLSERHMYLNINITYTKLNFSEDVFHSTYHNVP